MTHARQGFTLIEIMIALLIIGIMAGGAAYGIRTYLNRARKTKTVSTLKLLKGAIDFYQGDINKYPNTLKDLVKKPQDEKIAAKWSGPYVESKDVPEDGYGNKFVYKVTSGGEHPYELYSYGEKGKGAPKKEWLSVWNQ